MEPVIVYKKIIKEGYSLISIIIPIYNADRYLGRCLDSILSQSYKDIEIILIDDGSTDMSRLICEKYARKEPRIKIFFNENQGPGPARNCGLEMARGEYLFFVDADDELLPGALEENYKIAVQNKIDLIIFSYIKIVYKNKKPESEILCAHNNLYLESKKEIAESFLSLLNNRMFFIVWNKFYKRELLTKNDIRFTAIRKGQDAVFNFDVFRHTNSVYVNERVCYKYHFYDFNNITSRYTPMLFENYTTYHDKLRHLVNSWELNNDRIKERINELCFINICVCISNLVKPEDNNLSFKCKIKECNRILTHRETKGILEAININRLKIFHRVSYVLMRTKNSYINVFFYKLIRFIKSI